MPKIIDKALYDHYQEYLDSTHNYWDEVYDRETEHCTDCEKKE